METSGQVPGDADLSISWTLRDVPVTTGMGCWDYSIACRTPKSAGMEATSAEDLTAIDKLHLLYALDHRGALPRPQGKDAERLRATRRGADRPARMM